MLIHRLQAAIPSRAARITLGVTTYALFAATILTATLHRDPDENTLERKAELAQYYGRMALSSLELDTAEKYFRYSIDLIRACGGERSEATQGWYAEAHEDLADAYAAQGHLTKAERAYNKALVLYENATDPLSEELLGPLEGLKDIYVATGRDADARVCSGRINAIEAQQTSFAESEFANFQNGRARTAAHHPLNGLELADRLMDLGRLHFDSGEPDRAEIEFADAYATRLAILGPLDYRTVTAREHLGQARAYEGKVDQAREDLESALTLNMRGLGRESLQLLPELRALGDIAMKCSDFAAADTFYTHALQNVVERVGGDHWSVIPQLEALSRCRAALGQFAVARGLTERILRIHERTLGSQSYAVGIDLLKLAEIDDRAGSLGWARARCAAALATLNEAVGPRHPATVEARLYLRELKQATAASRQPDATVGERDEAPAPIADQDIEDPFA